MRSRGFGNLSRALSVLGKCALLVLLLAGLSASLVPCQAAAANSRAAAYKQWMYSFIPRNITSVQMTETNIHTWVNKNGEQHAQTSHVGGWYRAPDQIRFDAPSHICIQQGEDCWCCMRYTHKESTSTHPIDYWLQDFFCPDKWGCIGFGVNQLVSTRECAGAYNGAQCSVTEICYNEASTTIGSVRVRAYKDSTSHLYMAMTLEMWDATGQILVEHDVREYVYNQPLADSLFVHTMPTDTN